MEITPFLLISSLFACGYLVSGVSETDYAIKQLIKDFSKYNYQYKLISMKLRQSDVAYLGTAKLIEKLAKDKNDFADMCMNYLVTRNLQDLNLLNWRFHPSTWSLDNKNTPELAIQFAYDKENHLARKLREKLQFMDSRGKHFLEHSILDPQYDCLSRLNSLLTGSKRNTSDYTYIYEFDRSVTFLYRNYYTVPFDSSIDL